MNKKVLLVFGTRPEAIKMVPLVKELKKTGVIEPIVCSTAQHREMLDQVLEIFEIEPDYDLNIMQQRQTVADITIRALDGLNKVIAEVQPEMVLVHGDTTTTFAGSLAAFYQKVKIGHVEAGLRTFNKYFPFPEEMNRKLTGVLADMHFAPTEVNKQNLIEEGMDVSKIYVTGNTVIDALQTTVKKDYKFSDPQLEAVDFENKRVITLTAHRRENLGEPLRNICSAVSDIVDRYTDIEVVYPVHLNPVVRETAQQILGGKERVHLIEPLDVQNMHNLMAQSYMVLTDSGGLQEEAPALGKPVIVLRNETERLEAIEAGTVRMAGTGKQEIINHASLLLDDFMEYEKMAKAVNPYGDGKASKRIVDALMYEFGYADTRPDEFV